MSEWRVALPPGVGQPFEVYVNGVRQGLGRWAWFWGFWGIGTYKRQDDVDVRYEVDGQPMLAHALKITPPPS